MNDYNFGNFLCMLRESKGMTQADVASILDVTPASVSKWENGSSKPRVEVLFKLSEILGVRPEELMAGHYIEVDSLDSEVVREINERYEYLRKVDSHNTASVKFRRLLAFLIDWNIVGFTVMVTAIVLLILLRDYLSAGETWAGLILFGFTLTYPVFVILRDVIFGGRSIGKKIAGLVILDRQTGMLAKKGKRLVRNLFLPIYEVDAIVMLISGSTIGDRVGGTVVIPKKVYEAREADTPQNEVEKINSYEAPKSHTKRTVLIVVTAVVLSITLFVSGIMLLLCTKKDSEEYKVSYNYLVASECYKRLDAEESDIRMNSYSVNTRSNFKNPDKVTKTAEIGFVVGFHSFHVVCHEENGQWNVCDECTKFD